MLSGSPAGMFAGKTKINPSQKDLYEKAGYWTERSLLDYWNQSVKLHAEREFVVDDRGKRYTYKTLDEEAARLAGWFIKAGIKPGDVISFQVPPWSEFVVITIACLKAAAVAAPLGLCFMDEELAGLLNMVGSKIHFCLAHNQKRNLAVMMEGLFDAVQGMEKVVLLDKDRRQISPFDSYTDILATGSALKESARPNGNDVAVILCTSGTTRGCKAVMLTHNNIVFSEAGFNKGFGLTKEDIIFMPAPLSHATGFHHGIISPMLLGAKLVLQYPFHCRKAVEIMNREKCTYSMGATPFAYDILKIMEEENCKLPHLRFYLCGGAPVPTAMVRKAWKDFDILLCEVYGSTESVPHVFVRPEEALALDGLWSGRAMAGVAVRIVDENRNDVLPGQIGEEASRGPNVFVGYLHDENATEKALDDEGWYYSGDLCVADASGNIKFVGRKKDLIMRGGESLSANEIDENLEGCPGIAAHTVIGMPDERMGERICAYIVPAAGETPPVLADVLRYLEQKRIPKRHWPERLELIAAIPRTESGKVRKNLLVEDIKKRILKEEEEASCRPRSLAPEEAVPPENPM